MEYDLSQLDPSAFQSLCAALLEAEGYHFRLINPLEGPDTGIDFICESKGLIYIVQAKVVPNNRIAISVIRRAITDLQRGLTMTKADTALLLVSTSISDHFRKQLPYAPEVELWDATVIARLLDR